MTLFSLVLALGTFIGLTWTAGKAPPKDRQSTLTAGFLVLFSALIGARAAYVSFHWATFQDHLMEIPQVWLGGLAWPGALAGGLLGVLIWAWILGISAGQLADRLLPLLPGLCAAVWLGCWLSGCAYGPAVDWGVPARDEWGVWTKRLPAQLIGALLSVLIFWGIEALQQRKSALTAGLAAGLGLGGLSLTLLGASFLRADPYPTFQGLRLESWAGMGFLVAASLYLLYLTFGRFDKSK